MKRVALFLSALLACAPPASSPPRPRHRHPGVHVTVHPIENAIRPPLAVFVEEEGGAQSASIVPALTKRGIKVATVTFARDVSPRDLALVLGYLRDDGQRLVVIGAGAGADAVLAASLEPAVPRADAVIGLSGTYASMPAGADVPPVLLLSGADDDPAHAQGARRFARVLEAAGAKDVESYLVPAHDARSLLDWNTDDALTALVVSFITRGPDRRSIDGPFGAKQVWGRSPPLSYDALFTSDVITRPIDATFRAALGELFGEVAFELHPWPLREYHAVPIAKLGTGEWLVTTNIRGEQLTLSKADIQTQEPQLVIGIDDEKNLFRLFTRYRVNQEFSWKPRAPGDGPMPVMIRPVGPFVFFPKGAPPHLRDTSLATFGLLPASFRFVHDDPLASVRRLPPDLRNVLTGTDGCLKCHSLHGVGARAHHVRAIDGKEHGGHALPLEEYRPEVLRRFLFEQEAVAESFGVAPLKVPPETAKSLLDRVTRQDRPEK